MNDDIIEMIGISQAGRDAGRRVAVIGLLDDAHVLIADGRTHKVAHPKKKKLKHLRFPGERIDMCAMPVGDAGRQDAYLRRELAKEQPAKVIKEG